MPQQITVADDHPLFRDAITQLLQRTLDAAQVIQVASFEDLLNSLKTQPLPSLVLLDLKLGDNQGIDGLLVLKKHYPSLPVLIVSAYDDSQVIQMAMQYGANGFISKSSDMDRMAEVIKAVLAGDICFPESFDEAGTENQVVGFADLTPAQLKVLALLREGKPSKQMASIMSVTEATIKAHLTEIFRKLKVKNRTQAVLAAKQLELPDI